MPAKQEYQAQKPLDFEDETETVDTKSPKRQRSQKKPKRKDENKKIKPFRYIFSIAAIAGAFCLMLYRNNSAIMVKNPNVAPDGYIAISDYRVFAEKNKELTVMNTIFEDDYYISEYKYPDYTTPLGIGANSSWSDFVEAYGDYHFSEASFNLNYDEDVDDDRDRYFSVYDEMTVRELDQKYVKSGIVDLRRYQITIEFETVVWGSEIGYTEQEIQQVRNHHYDSNWPTGSWFNPKIQTYTYEFYFRKAYGETDKDAECTLDFVSLDKYAY